MSTPAREIAEMLDDFNRRIKILERTPQLANSAIMDGALRAYADGSLTAIIGRQFDGTTAVNVVNGAIPPRPTGFTVTPQSGGLRVVWSGEFDNGVAFTPMDFARVEVHASTASEYVPNTVSLRGTIETPQGGEPFLALPAVPHSVYLVTRTTSGVASAPSGPVTGTPEAGVAGDATEITKGIIQLAGDLAGTADEPIVRGLSGKAARARTRRTITGAYTLVAADAVDIILHSTAATAVTVTLPQDGMEVIAQEAAIPWRAYGAGQITFAGGPGAILVSRGSALKSAGQYAEGVVTKVTSDTWLVSGDVIV